MRDTCKAKPARRGGRASSDPDSRARKEVYSVKCVCSDEPGLEPGYYIVLVLGLHPIERIYTVDDGLRSPVVLSSFSPLFFPRVCGDAERLRGQRSRSRGEGSLYTRSKCKYLSQVVRRGGGYLARVPPFLLRSSDPEQEQEQYAEICN